MSGTSRSALHRGLGVVTLAGTIFVFVSSGPFGLEVPVRDAGPGATALLLLVGLLFWGLSHTLVATELSSAAPVEGGFFRWIEMAFGQFWGFQAAWWYWIKMLADTSIYPIMFAEYLKYWTPWLGPWQGRLVRVLFIWLFVAFNLRGIRAGGRLALGFTLFILAPFVLFVLLGAPHLGPTAVTPLVAEGHGTLEALGLALMFGMWSYNTLDSVSIVAGEVIDPTRTYGRAYALALPCIFLGYILPVAVGAAVDPDYSAWTDHHFTTLAGLVGGVWLAAWVALGALLSNASLFHGALMINTRVPLVLAEEGRFPVLFAAVGRRTGAPWMSLLFAGAAHTVIALAVDHFVDIVVWNQWLNLGIYTLLYMAFLRLRWARPDLPRRFRVPGGWPGAIGICVGPFLICWAGVPIGARHLVWPGIAGLLSGPLIFAVLSRIRPRIDPGTRP